MSELRQVGDLQIGEDYDFQRKEWRFERIGWAVMALVLLAALLGLLGPGPLSNASAGDKGGPLWVDYDRFVQRSAGTRFEIHAAPGTAPDGTLRLWIDRETVGRNEIHSIEPQPEQVTAAGDRLIYDFNVADPGSETVVHILFEPMRYLRQPVRMGIEGGPDLHFIQTIYP